MTLPEQRMTAPGLADNFSGDVVERLGALLHERGFVGLGDRLVSLAALTGEDLRAIESDLLSMPRDRSLVMRSATQLLDLGGKRLRPLCVALGARVGRGFGPEARELAVAVELVHSATLLHDDVVDLGDVRRGARTARVLYGNAASIFAGDWMLVEALRRVRVAGVPGTLDRLLEVIAEMIIAESAQLENRGALHGNWEVYFRIVEGKTAALFRWAMFAGGRAGGLDDDQCAALEAYGMHLGVAFQAIDDLLDVSGNGAATGKALFADLREGKLTYPVLHAAERDPSLLGLLRMLIATPLDAPLDQDVVNKVLRIVEVSGGLEACRLFARRRGNEAVAAITPLPASEAKQALMAVAAAAVERDR